MSDCCHQPKEPKPQSCCASKTSCCDSKTKSRPDLVLWGSLSVIVLSVLADATFSATLQSASLTSFTYAVTELLGRMWWGLVIGILFVSVLGQIPREFVMKVLGDGNKTSGVFRAAFAGILLDLCSHGILLVGMQLYKKGASLGQVMAFLIASPWNSFSLTLILWALIGFKWMMTFLLLSFVVAIVSGLIFNILVKREVLPQNPYAVELADDFRFWQEAKKGLKTVKLDATFLSRMIAEGVSGSKMILRWILFGVVLASLIRTFVPTDYFTQFFGPSMVGLILTVVAATIIEVCSEGSAPIGADLLTRAAAPGNSFTFLMTGVSTDYTEIMALKETTHRWKIALFLPVVTLPQIIILGWILNQL